MPIADQRIAIAYVERAAQNHAAARFAALNRLSWPACSAAHWAAELYLKGFLRGTGMREPDVRELGHNLHRLWNRARQTTSWPDPTSVERAVLAIHPFENIRYPEHILEEGVELHVNPDIGLPSVRTDLEQVPPRYVLELSDLDTIGQAAIDVLGANPLFFQGMMSAEARDLVPWARG